MKIFTIEVCGQCPAYDPVVAFISPSYQNYVVYHNDGDCRRNRAIDGIRGDQKPPKDCPLEEFKNAGK